MVWYAPNVKFTQFASMAFNVSSAACAFPSSSCSSQIPFRHDQAWVVEIIVLEAVSRVSGCSVDIYSLILPNNWSNLCYKSPMSPFQAQAAQIVPTGASEV
jgi:hypothetical protein